MTKERFLSLYNSTTDDEDLTPFLDEIGFTIIKKYPLGTIFFNDDLRMFVKLGVSDKGELNYSVNATKPRVESDTTHYSIIDTEDYPKKLTNFYSSDSEEFSFEPTTGKVVHNASQKIFTLNEFVQILIENHLADRLFLKRILNKGVERILIILFWLIDKHYDKVEIMITSYHSRNSGQPITNEEINIEPFFKYFKISRNVIFLFFFSTVILTVFMYFPVINLMLRKIWILGDVSLSNPFILIYAIFALVIAEKFTLFLTHHYSSFFSDDRNSNKKFNIIRTLQEYQYKNHFKLKI